MGTSAGSGAQVSAPRCSHPSGRIRLLASSVLWCSDCGAIARTDGGMLEDAKPKGPPPGSSAWLSPLRQWPQPEATSTHPQAGSLRRLGDVLLNAPIAPAPKGER